MDAGGGGFAFLADEKFDFDISLSPTSAKDNEECDDEVFVGPVRHKEKCVSAAIELQESEKKTPPSNELVAWSPLAGDKFVEIFKEAHLLALHLECFASETKKEELPQTVSKFVEESKAKLKLFDTFNEVSRTPVDIKRETYCIQNSPFHQLPPSIQQQIGWSKAGAENTDCQILSQNLSSPMKVPKVVKQMMHSPLAQKAKAPQGKSSVLSASTGKTVSRLQPLKAPAAQTKNSLTVDMPKAAKKLSPVRRRNPSSTGSTEDLLSANSSIASDVSDSSFIISSVRQSKKTLNPPSKITRNKMQFKTPSTGYRRNTSSSSSSRSSINTSLNSSVSSPPAADAKLNATHLNTSMNSQLKANTVRLVRPLGGLGSSLKTATTDLSKRHLKPVAVKNAKANDDKPSSMSVTQAASPVSKMLRQTSAPNLRRLAPPPTAKSESAVKASATKSKTRVMPTPTSRLKQPQKAEGMSPDRTTGKTLKPMRLSSCGDIGSGISQSTPIHAANGKPINASLPGRCIPSTPNSKLTSALPTPSRKTSGVLTTPRTMPRSIPFLRPTPAIQALSKSAMKLPARPVESEQKKPRSPKSPCSPTEVNMTAEIRCFLNFSPESITVPEAQIENGAVRKAQNTEVLLIDLGIDQDSKVKKLPEKESQPLIDLSNTPEVSKPPIPLKPTNVVQLIDLSSPLIKLSPAANKENSEFDFPLVTF